MNRIEPTVVAFHDVVILLILSMISDNLNALREFLIARRHSAGFSTSSEILSRIEAESGRLPYRTSLLPLTLLG